MRELLHFHTNRQGDVQNPDGEIVSIKIGGTLTHPPYGLDLSSNTENRVAADRKDHAGIVTPSCGLSFPSFGRRVTFSELLRQVFSLWLRQAFSFWLRQAFSLWPRQAFSLWPRRAFSFWLRQVSSFWLRQVFSLWLRQVSSFWLQQIFSLWPWLQPGPAIPAAAVSECDGGHGAAAGCARLLLPSAAQCLHGFGARPRGIPESF